MDEGEKHIPRSRKKKPTPVAVKVLTGVAAAVILGGIAGAAGYLYYTDEGEQYRTVFFPNTVVNGIDVSQKTVEEVQNLVASRMEEYILTIVGRGGVEEKITGEEVGLHYVFDGSLEQYLASQDPMDWWNHRDTATEYQISTMIQADDEMLQDRIEKLVFLDDAQAVEPVDAYLSDYIEGEGYKVIPEEEGTVLNKVRVKKAVEDAVHNLDTILVLEDLDVYKEPGITSDDAVLNEKANKLNSYLDVTVTYQFGDNQEVLDKDTIRGWISMAEDGSIVLDNEQVTAYVKGLAEKYDTLGKPKTLKTTGGETVTITGGSLGWKINQKEEAAELCALIETGESQTREPVYSSTAKSHGTNDYGDTYVELNLTDQHMYYYKNGEMVLESDFVSGSHAKNHDTPTGAYFINYKQKDRVLRGERRPDGSYEYESPVSFWMPFNGGIGLHDASWRGTFGGKIYLTNGSHGCVNLPVSVAKSLYEIISTGDPVLVYTTDGSGSSEYPGSTNNHSQGSSASSGTQSVPEETKPVSGEAQPEPSETQPVPGEIQPASPETQPVPGETQPAPSETQPITGETQPASSETQPVTEETQPAADPGAPRPDAESQAPAGPTGSSGSPDGPSSGNGPMAPGSEGPSQSGPETVGPVTPPSEASGPMGPLTQP